MDISACVRVVKSACKLATRGLDKDGMLSLYINEIPIYCTKRKRSMTAGFQHSLGVGDIGRVVINVGVCYTEERFVDTLFHELAHAINFWVHGNDCDVHGPKWKAVMAQLGQKPERCHDYRDRR